MTLYVDSSALLKRYINERDSSRARQLLASDPELATARITVVEIRRNLTRHLDGTALKDARQEFEGDLIAMDVIELDAHLCELAATIAESTGARSLDALHLGAAQRVGGEISFLTFDSRQARIARQLGLAVVGS